MDDLVQQLLALWHPNLGWNDPEGHLRAMLDVDQLHVFRDVAGRPTGWFDWWWLADDEIEPFFLEGKQASPDKTAGHHLCITTVRITDPAALLEYRRKVYEVAGTRARTVVGKKNRSNRPPLLRSCICRRGISHGRSR